MRAWQTMALMIATWTGAPPNVHGRAPAAEAPADAAQAVEATRRRLQEALEELARVRAQAAEETIPLSRKLSELETELSRLRDDYQQTVRALDSRALELTNLRAERTARQAEHAYLGNLFDEYLRNFESRLHIAELQRYRAAIDAVRRESERREEDDAVLNLQAQFLDQSIDRIEEALGGMRFEGSAVDAEGLVRQGVFVIVGPAAIFRSHDGQTVGTVEQRMGSLEPAVMPFGKPEDAQAVAELAATGAGMFPLDPTLGAAHKIEGTRETLAEHIRKGGPVMVPILGLAAVAALTALYKWLALALVRKPSRRKLATLMEAVGRGDAAQAGRLARAIRGPAGRMLQAGVAHLGRPRELIEEAMYEQMLAARLKLERWLPLLQISAAAAPLLGLLGTVTGIIQTFKLMTVFGSGDVKMLSGGISEALITTEFGLIVAIPALLVHAWLSRKARGIVHRMEQAAVALLNAVIRAEAAPARANPAGSAMEPEPDEDWTVGDPSASALGGHERERAVWTR